MSTIADLSKARATFALSFPWLDRTAGTQGVEEVRIWARHPRPHYGRFRFANRPVAPNQDAAKAMAFSAQSRVAFMDITKFTRCNSDNVVSALTGQAVWPVGFTYTIVWACPVAKRLLLTTEPDERHLPAVEAECAARSWPFHVFPAGVGMRNPPTSRLLVASPQGLDIGSLIAALERAMPRRIAA